MSADDQAFLDILSSIPTDITRYSSDVADYINRHVDKLSDALRENLSSWPWLPDAIRPRPPPPPPLRVVAVPASAYERLRDWAERHRLLAGALALATGTVIYAVYRSRRRGGRKVRRARRARSGGRLDVVVVAGSPALPLTRSLALDLERKGFIVFVVCNAVEDEALVHHLSRPDVRPLTIDITDPPRAGAAIDRFAQYLQAPHAAVPGARHHHLSLRAVVLVPSLHYPSSPIATIPPSSFADLFHTHLLRPILTVQAFLPLLTANLSSSSSSSPPSVEHQHQQQQQQTTTEKPQQPPPKVLVLTPSIVSSICPPFHAPEATVCSALTAFTEVLAAELHPLSIPVTHIQLGTFDFSAFAASSASSSSSFARGGPLGLLPPAASSPLAWPEPARRAYASNYAAAQSSSVLGGGRGRGVRGTPLRRLHDVVFDVLDGSERRAVVRVGLGAGVYGFVGRWVPRGLVAWMLGAAKPVEGGGRTTWRRPHRREEGGGTSREDSSLSPLSSGGGGGSSSSESGGEEGTASQEFVAVPSMEDAHVWKEG